MGQKRFSHSHNSVTPRHWHQELYRGHPLYDSPREAGPLEEAVSTAHPHNPPKVLYENDIGAEGAKVLLRKLARFTALEALDLSGNRVGDGMTVRARG